MNSSEPIIRVGILSSEEIEFILKGEFFFDKKPFTGYQKAIWQDGRMLFEGEEYSELVFEPTHEQDSFDLLNVVIGIGFHWERKENQRFNGALKIIPVEARHAVSLQAINIIPVEKYLTSVISSEMSATASAELLKAHAVISRSWLLRPIFQHSVVSWPAASQDKEMKQAASVPEPGFIEKWYERDAHVHFEVCADDHCQRYQGITRASTEAVAKAIELTRGQVLMYEGQICDARFSKSCGGATETFENCWAPEHHPYLNKIFDNTVTPEDFGTDLTVEENAEKWVRQRPEAFCNTSDKKILAQVLNNYDQETNDFYRWKVEYTQDEIAEIIRRRSGIDFGPIADLVPIKRGESGRIIQLKIVGAKQTIVVGKELEIRRWLSNSHLYSSAFVVDKYSIVDGIPGKFILSGAGWGHGVGLCQIGAAVMGEKGYKYIEILSHYFKNSELKRIY